MQVCPLMGQAVAMGHGVGDWHSPACCGSPLCRGAPLGLSWSCRGLGKMLLWGHPPQTHWQSSRGFCSQSFPSPTSVPAGVQKGWTKQSLAQRGYQRDCPSGCGQSHRQLGNNFPLEQSCGTGKARVFGLPVPAAIAAMVLSTLGLVQCHGRSLCHCCLASPAPAPQGRSCSRRTEPEYTVFAQSP